MTSATEKDGTSDLIECFFKVAKPGEWISSLDDGSLDQEFVQKVLKEKIAKAMNV